MKFVMFVKFSGIIIYIVRNNSYLLDHLLDYIY